METITETLNKLTVKKNQRAKKLFASLIKDIQRLDLDDVSVNNRISRNGAFLGQEEAPSIDQTQ